MRFSNFSQELRVTEERGIMISLIGRHLEEACSLQGETIDMSELGGTFCPASCIDCLRAYPLPWKHSRHWLLASWLYLLQMLCHSLHAQFLLSCPVQVPDLSSSVWKSNWSSYDVHRPFDHAGLQRLDDIICPMLTLEAKLHALCGYDIKFQRIEASWDSRSSKTVIHYKECLHKQNCRFLQCRRAMSSAQSWESGSTYTTKMYWKFLLGFDKKSRAREWEMPSDPGPLTRAVLVGWRLLGKSTAAQWICKATTQKNSM